MGGEACLPGELRAAVREHAERGVDIIKVMASGGAMTAGTDVLACQYTLEKLRTVADEAHACGLPVTAHAHALPAVIQAVDAGVDGIEHCSCVTGRAIEVPPDLPGRLARNRIIVCPTLGRNPRPRPRPRCWRSSNAPGSPGRTARPWPASSPGRGPHRLRRGRRHQRRKTPRHPGTRHRRPHRRRHPGRRRPRLRHLASRQACGLGDRKGPLHPGYDADLAVVDGDPVGDIAALTAVRAVYLGGRAAQPAT